MTKNKKNFIIGLVVAIGVVLVVIATVLLKKENVESYRLVKVQENTGVTEVTRMEQEILNAYEGMKLEQGDDVHVTEDSNMIMQLDDDKYVFAEENTKFQLEVSGQKEKGKVKICLNEGSALIEIQNKLSEESFFEIETPNATMAVRGTVFYVEADKNEAGEIVTKVSVFEGKVETIGEGKTGEGVLLPSGFSITLTGDVNPIEQQEEIKLEELPESVLLHLSNMEEKEDEYFDKEEVLQALEKIQSAEVPTSTPTETPTEAPMSTPTETPTVTPTEAPTSTPTEAPTSTLTVTPTEVPTSTPTVTPTEVPTSTPTVIPTEAPTSTPTPIPTIELEWTDTTLKVSGAGMITDEIFEKIVYDVFINNGENSFSLVIGDGISGIRINPLSNTNLATISLLYGVTVEEIVYEVFNLMSSFTLPQSVNSIQIEGMPTAEEISLNVIVKPGSYAEDWATQRGFVVSYY